MQFIEKKAKKVTQSVHVATNTQKGTIVRHRGSISQRYIARPMIEIEDRQI